MPAPPDRLRELRQKLAGGEQLFWFDGDLAVFDSSLVHRLNAQNYRNLVLPEKLADLLRGRQGEPITWAEMRRAWLDQLSRLDRAGGTAALAARMDRCLDDRLGDEVDLVRTLQEVFGRSLLPVVLDGLGTADHTRLERDQDMRIASILQLATTARRSWRERLHLLRIRTASAGVIRREVGGRARGTRPRRTDLADVLVDRWADLGADRVVFAVVGLLTAIGGPPGAAGVCLAVELLRHPRWADHLAAELRAVSENEFFADPTGRAPTTYRFVQEVLRLWSPPLLLSRRARHDLDVGDERVETGQSFLLSPHLMQRDPAQWSDPDRFDPDRWLPGGEASRPGTTFVPFGFAPRACLGAKLGLDQLMVLAHRLTTRYRIELDRPIESVPIAFTAIPLPLGFRGRLERRSVPSVATPSVASAEGA